MISHSKLTDEESKIEAKMEDEKPIWAEDALVSYKKFLEYVGIDVKKDIEHNQQVMSALSFFYSKESKFDDRELKVHAYNGKFYPLTTAIKSPLKCSKLVLRNLDCDYETGLVSINFEPTIMNGIIGINATKNEADKMEIAYRNIVPSEFSQARQLAGPMGYHEYIIDGKNCKDFKIIQFFINSDFKQTPIKIVLENCKGSILVVGLNEEEVNKIIENKCDSKQFQIHNPKPKDSRYKM